jgi:hypothetical protein
MSSFSLLFGDRQNLPCEPYYFPGTLIKLPSLSIVLFFFVCVSFSSHSRLRVLLSSPASPYRRRRCRDARVSGGFGPKITLPREFPREGHDQNGRPPPPDDHQKDQRRRGEGGRRENKYGCPVNPPPQLLPRCGHTQKWRWICKNTTRV